MLPFINEVNDHFLNREGDVYLTGQNEKLLTSTRAKVIWDKSGKTTLGTEIYYSGFSSISISRNWNSEKIKIAGPNGQCPTYLDISEKDWKDKAKESIANLLSDPNKYHHFGSSGDRGNDYGGYGWS